jgi:hypothetical protein
VESGYINGQPLHIADPDQSGFALLSFQQFQAMSPHDVQDLFRRKNVVVSGCQHPDLQFDEAGLRTLAPLDSQVSIIGEALHVWYCYLPAKPLQIILFRHQARIGTPLLLL